MICIVLFVLSITVSNAAKASHEDVEKFLVMKAELTALKDQLRVEIADLHEQIEALDASPEGRTTCACTSLISELVSAQETANTLGDQKALAACQAYTLSIYTQNVQYINELLTVSTSVFTGCTEVNISNAIVQVVAPDFNASCGNLIVGSNAPNPTLAKRRGTGYRSGKHNLVVGNHHGYSGSNGVVGGDTNNVGGYAGSISGGSNGTSNSNYNWLVNTSGELVSGDIGALIGDVPEGTSIQAEIDALKNTSAGCNNSYGPIEAEIGTVGSQSLQAQYLNSYNTYANLRVILGSHNSYYQSSSAGTQMTALRTNLGPTNYPASDYQVNVAQQCSNIAAWIHCFDIHGINC